MTVAQRLAELGVALPSPPQPAGAYTRAVRTGNLIFVAGQLPMTDGEITCAGRTGAEVGLEEAQGAARLCALNALSVLDAEVGLDRVRQIVRLVGFVCSTAEFADHPKVVNGASDLMAEVFGDRGVHARLAVGCLALPLGATVELEVIAEVE